MKKTFTFFILLLFYKLSFAQEQKFWIQAKILDKKENPIGDVYIVNTNSNEKDITLSNGIFTIHVLPSDTLVLSHISYHRKMVTVQSILMNPIITLESENQEINEVTVSPDKMNDYDRAKKNLLFLNDFKTTKYNKMKPESDPLQSSITEHNRLMRTQAGSVSFLPLLAAPVSLVEQAVQKHKSRKLSTSDYFSTKEQKVLVDETDEKEEESAEN